MESHVSLNLPAQQSNDKIIKSAGIPILHLTGIWLFLRFLTSLVVASISPLYPKTAIEKSIAIWPPAQNILTWLNRIFVAPWYRWDAILFGRILTHGYTPWDGTTSFNPLYPLLSWPLYKLGLDPTLSLLVTSSLAALGLFWVFYRLATLEHAPATAWTALLYLVTFPAAFILFAPYSESLFLLWTVLALYTMRRGRWGLVAICSFLAALSRQQGLFLAIPIAWWAWEASGRSLRGIKSAWRAWLAALAAPFGLVVWGIYRIGYLHEGSLDFSSIQGLIYSALLSPAANAIIPGQAFHWPWEAFRLVVSDAIHFPEINVFVNLTLGISFVVAFVIAWRYLNIADRLYSLAIILVSFSVTTIDLAYVSLPRHLLLALPVFIGLAAALRKPWQKGVIIAVQLTGMIFLMALYVFTQLIP
jgi:hypothetical protein